MGYPESIQIETTKITIYFTPPESRGKPARKPRTPIPLIDRVFQGVDDIFEPDDFFVADPASPGLCSSFRSSN